MTIVELVSQIFNFGQTLRRVKFSSRKFWQHDTLDRLYKHGEARWHVYMPEYAAACSMFVGSVESIMLPNYHVYGSGRRLNSYVKLNFNSDISTINCAALSQFQFESIIHWREASPRQCQSIAQSSQSLIYPSTLCTAGILVASETSVSVPAAVVIHARLGKGRFFFFFFYRIS